MAIAQQLCRLFRRDKILRDDLIARIRCATAGAGMLSEGNVYAFDFVLQRLPAEGALLEIGSFGGLSTNAILHLLEKHGVQRPFFTCDPWLYEGFHDRERAADAAYMAYVDGSGRIARTDYMAFVRDSFVRTTRFFHPHALPHTLEMRSDDFFQAWRRAESLVDVFGRTTRLGGPLAFAYVDGDHAYESAHRDAEHALEFLVPGGWLLLDDSADGAPFGSARLARELRGRKGLQLAMKNPNYLFRKI